MVVYVTIFFHVTCVKNVLVTFQKVGYKKKTFQMIILVFSNENWIF